MLKETHDAAASAKAVELFGKAIQLAPWWSEARYNRAIALEASGQFREAIGGLNIYLTFKLTGSPAWGNARATPQESAKPQDSGLKARPIRSDE